MKTPIIALAVVMLLSGGCKEQDTKTTARELKRVQFASVTKHDYRGEWVTTRSFPQDEVDALLKDGWSVVTIDEQVGVVTLQR